MTFFFVQSFRLRGVSRLLHYVLVNHAHLFRRHSGIGYLHEAWVEVVRGVIVTPLQSPAGKTKNFVNEQIDDIISSSQ
jgi:hypothetical protein